MGIDQYGLVGGVDRGAYSRWNPWHHRSNTENKLITLDRSLTIDEAIEWTFPYEVREIPLQDVLFADGADEYKALVRSDNGFVLSVVSSSYGIVQPHVLGDLGKAAQEADASFGNGTNKLNCFSLHKGKVAVLYLERDEVTSLGGGDVQLQRGLALITSHNGTYALSAKPVSWVVECMNTMPSRNAMSVASVRHTKGAMDYVPAMRQAIVDTYRDWSEMDKEIEKLLSQGYSRMEYTDVLVPALMGERPDEAGRAQTNYDNKFEAIVSQWGAVGQQAAIGTKWGALMGVNSHELWTSKVKGDRTERTLARFLANDFPLTRKAHAILQEV
jgi:hypothetical protein